LKTSIALFRFSLLTFLSAASEAAFLSLVNSSAASFLAASIRASDFAPSINVGSASIVCCAVFVFISRVSDSV
jgi:hypothetical protein